MRKIINFLTIGAWYLIPLYSYAETTIEMLQTQWSATQGLSRDWAVPPHTMEIVSGVTVTATQDSRVLVGRKFLEGLNSLPDTQLNKSVLRFTLAHEIWHIKQYASNISLATDTAMRPLVECGADAMASYGIASHEFKVSETASLEERKAAWGRISELRRVPEVLAELSSTSTKTNESLNIYQRALAIHFGITRAAYDWTLPQLAGESKDAKQLHSVVKRFVLDLASKTPAESLLEICRHIVRDSGDALQKTTALPTGFETENIGTVDAASIQEVEVTNTSNRPIRYSITGLSGFRPKGKSPDSSKYVYVDAQRVEADIPAKGKVKLKVKLRFPLAGFNSEKHDSFSPVLSFDEEALVAARYIGGPIATPSCNDAWNSPEMQTPIHRALLRVGAAAKEGFKPVRGAEIMPGFNVGPKSYYLSFQQDGIKGDTTVNQDGSSRATLELFQSSKLEEARLEFDAAVKRFQKACPVSSTNTAVIDGKDGLPTFRVPRLTAFSSAFLTISKYEDRQGKTPNLYTVYWLVSPEMEE